MPDVIGGCRVHQVFNGTPLNFERRRYGRATFTWVYWWDGNEWKSCGDPWPSIIVPKQDLIAIFGNPECAPA